MERKWDEDWFVEAQRVWVGTPDGPQADRRTRERTAVNFFWRALGMRRPRSGAGIPDRIAVEGSEARRASPLPSGRRPGARPTRA